MLLDVVIPVYNEGDNIIGVLRSLETSVKTPLKVFICFDDEKDDTLQALKGYSSKTFDVIPVKNQGSGVHGAVMTGFRVSSSSAVLVLPADDNYNAVIIDHMHRLFVEGADLVAASRFMRGGCLKGCPWLKAALVRVAAFTLYHIARLPTHDPTNGFRLFSRRVIDDIVVESTQGFAFSMELLIKCHKRGWAVKEVPALWFERKKRKSRFMIFKWLPAYLRWFLYAFGTTKN